MTKILVGVCLVGMCLSGCGGDSSVPPGFARFESASLSRGTRLYTQKGRLAGVVQGYDNFHRFPGGRQGAAMSIQMVGRSSPVWMDETMATKSFLVKD